MDDNNAGRVPQVRPGDRVRFIWPGDWQALSDLIELTIAYDLEPGDDVAALFSGRYYYFKTAEYSHGRFEVLGRRSARPLDEDQEETELGPVAAGLKIVRFDSRLAVELWPYWEDLIENGWWSHLLQRITEWGVEDVTLAPLDGQVEPVSAEKLEHVQQVDADAALAAEAAKYGVSAKKMRRWRQIRTLNETTGMTQKAISERIRDIALNTVQAYVREMRKAGYYDYQEGGRQG